MTIKCKCSVCGKEFDALKSTAKYCSKACANEARRARIAEEKIHPKKRNENGMAEKICLLCGKAFSPKTAAANNRSCCYECMPDGIQLKRGDFLTKIKKLRGGKCERCGYNTTQKALEFHHLDPSKKDFTISNACFKLENAINESKKCILLCANCHRELHAGIWDIGELYKERKEKK